MTRLTPLYTTQQGLRYCMDNFFLNDRNTHFPSDDKDYPHAFYNIEQHLNTNIHNEVNLGAHLADNAVLTDHGIKHIETVMNRAEMIYNSFSPNLIGYELYFLLLAIHIHDIGNIYGRTRHEERIAEVISQISDYFPDDAAARSLIISIAKCHSGTIEDNLDTICTLPDSSRIHNITIRPRLLASILRLSDELAEDSSRASRYLLENNMLPENNRIYHYYAKTLRIPTINSNEILLHYIIDNPSSPNPGNIDYLLFRSRFPHNGSNIYLYDYIMQRITKCYCELRYCSRFLLPHSIRIDAIRATICIMNGHTKMIDDISIRLADYGYPYPYLPGIATLIEPTTDLPILSGADLLTRLNMEPADDQPI